MSFRVEQAADRRRQSRRSATRSCAVASVEGAVKGGRSPAKRTLEGDRNANTLKGLGLVAAFRDQRPSPSGGKDFITALGGGARGGCARRARQGHPPHRGRFHTKRPKPCCFLLLNSSPLRHDILAPKFQPHVDHDSHENRISPDLGCNVGQIVG
jgi:hypothetical protein